MIHRQLQLVSLFLIAKNIFLYISLQLQREAPLRRLMKLTRAKVVESPYFEQRYVRYSHRGI